ncbi:guanine nucleotide binding protein, alpha subunit [Coprinopsis marcescibilis]|uniref:Guanine nucleotide binding protein, alpha subunit n=1 Tax=Coprinopsis marcescibilis TaxID=230819 RepID=A0A5C3KKI4_COPMA|nr:guanine nucleotide binding protein, alpha subunit [Coprinopsis marcescibilis]
MWDCSSEAHVNKHALIANGMDRSSPTKIGHIAWFTGSAESGKSTIVKQMKIIHKNGFPRRSWLSTGLSSTKSLQHVVVYVVRAGLECVKYSNRPVLEVLTVLEKILEYQLDPEQPYFSPEIAEAMDQFWNDPVIPKIMEKHSSKFYLMDSAGYFFSEVLRIGKPNYLANETDVLWAHQKSVGISETRFTMGQLSIHMFDVGGQRSERKSRYIVSMSIIFCTALSEYDQVLREERTQNQMAESLILFNSVINSGWFLQTSIILFLNKIDVFKNKLPKVYPPAQYFPKYTGSADINKAAKYILWKFMQSNRARLSVYPHLTQATDTTNIWVVFSAVKETILHNALKDSRIL